jgi:hypothetical protein
MILAGLWRLTAGMIPQQKRAYVLADNKLALNAGWDEELLALELQNLIEIHSARRQIRSIQKSRCDMFWEKYLI